MSTEQINGFIKQVEAGWQSQSCAASTASAPGDRLPVAFEYGELGVADALRLRALVSENGRLKRLLAEACLHIEALKVGLERKRRVGPPQAESHQRAPGLPLGGRFAIMLAVYHQQ